MTQDEARLKVSEILTEKRDKGKSALKKLVFAEGMVLAVTVGGMALGNAMGVDPTILQNLSGPAATINGASAVIFTSLLAPLLSGYQKNKKAAEITRTTPNPDIDYVQVLKDFGYYEEEKEEKGKTL